MITTTDDNIIEILGDRNSYHFFISQHHGVTRAKHCCLLSLSYILAMKTKILNSTS